jgi:hypothetical protein
LISSIAALLHLYIVTTEKTRRRVDEIARAMRRIGELEIAISTVFLPVFVPHLTLLPRV